MKTITKVSTPFGEFSTSERDVEFLVLAKPYGNAPIKAYWCKSKDAAVARVSDIKQRHCRMLGVYGAKTHVEA